MDSMDKVGATIGLLAVIFMLLTIGLSVGSCTHQESLKDRPAYAWELYQESIGRTEKRYDEAYGFGGVE